MSELVDYQQVDMGEERVRTASSRSSASSNSIASTKAPTAKARPARLKPTDSLVREEKRLPVPNHVLNTSKWKLYFTVIFRIKVKFIRRFITFWSKKSTKSCNETSSSRLVQLKFTSPALIWTLKICSRCSGWLTCPVNFNESQFCRQIASTFILATQNL